MRSLSLAIVLSALCMSGCQKFPGTVSHPVSFAAVGAPVAGRSLFVAPVSVSGQDASSVDAAQLQSALQAQLVKAGFHVVSSESVAHELTARLTLGDILYRTGWADCPDCVLQGRAALVLEGSGAVVDEVQLTYDLHGMGTPLTELADQVTSTLVERLEKSDRLVAYAKAHPPSDGAPATVASSPAPASAPPPAPPSEPMIPKYTLGSPQPNAYALVVGIEHYRDLPSPAGARADAEKFAALAKTTLGIPEANVHLRLDDHASKGDLAAELQWLRTNVPPGGRAFFYFAGHGAPDTTSDPNAQGTPYLIPYDGNASALAATAVSLSEVTQALSATRAKDALAILDSCFSGEGGRSVLPKGARPLVRVKDVAPSAQLAMFTAASGVQISGPSAAGDGGLFTKYLLDALGTAAADQNGDGQVSLQELSDWVGPRVTRDAKRDGRDQVPSVTLGANAGTPGSFVVAYGVAH